MNALIGGAVIGVAASMLWLFSGRIAGVSGILGTTLMSFTSRRDWRMAFLVGLPLGTYLIALIREPVLVMESSPLLFIVSGILVGVGTQIGSGCTSGHGVCGLARFSTRSLAATVVFMVTAALVVWVRSLGG